MSLLISQAIKTNTFFCQTCLIDRPVEIQSPDPRYCHGCYDFLIKEAEGLLVKPRWVPKIPKKLLQKVEAKKTIYHIPPPEYFLHTKKTAPTAPGAVKKGRPATTETIFKIIHQLSNDGKNGNEIFAYLINHQEKVSRRTVYNILAGQRLLV